MMDRLDAMQAQVQHALKTAEEYLKKKPAPRPDEVFRWVLNFMAALNEAVVADAMGCLFPKGPEATTAFKTRAAIQLKELASHILERTDAQDLRQQAEKLRDWADRITV